MSYIKFDKTQLINLEYSLDKEVIRSNRSGGYAFTTLVGCNTRKYHGLLACPIPEIDGGIHLLLSSLDETVIQHGSSFNLAIRKYPGKYEPKGHKYIRDFDTEPNISIIYRVGGVILKKEMVLITGKEQILIKYTLLDAHSPTTLQFRPFLAFRNIHSLSKANFNVINHYQKIKNGIRLKMYDQYPYLYMQFSKSVEFVPVPDWYLNVEYIEEQKRGYDFHEDLFVPGYFELPIKKGESIVFSASTFETETLSLKYQTNKELNSRITRGSFENCLINSAQQFIINRNNEKYLVAGLPWYKCRARDTFIALPGLTLSLNDIKTFHEVLESIIKRMEGPLFPDKNTYGKDIFVSVDASLWFIWAIQKYCEQTNDFSVVIDKYSKVIFYILEEFIKGVESLGIRIDENGLLWQKREDLASTWMNAYDETKPITPRYGYNVETNALWYNAIMFGITISKLANNNETLNILRDLPNKIEVSFIEKFWNQQRGYLADFIDENKTNWQLRPNQIIAASLFFTPIDDENIRKSIVDRVERELLTAKGLRSLSPNDEQYMGIYEGNHNEREYAMYQGSAWPWLMAHFTEAYLKIYGKSGIHFITKLYNGFEEDVIEHGIGSISELYDGDPPHKPNGAPSMAISTAELLRMKQLIELYNE